MSRREGTANKPTTDHPMTLQTRFVGQVPTFAIQDFKLMHGEMMLGRVEKTFEEGGLIAINLRYFRSRLGKTQKDVSEETGISVSMLQKYESGTSVPKITNLIRLSLSYGVSLDRMCGLATEDEEELLDLYRFSTNSQRSMILDSVRAMKENVTTSTQDTKLMLASAQEYYRDKAEAHRSQGETELAESCEAFAENLADDRSMLDETEGWQRPCGLFVYGEDAPPVL